MVDCQDCEHLDLDDFWCSKEQCFIEDFIVQCDYFNPRKKENKVHYPEIYCQIHQVKLRFVRKELGVEIYYCPKCRKEYCEFTDISPVYWSNYEFLYNEIS